MRNYERTLQMIVTTRFSPVMSSMPERAGTGPGAPGLGCHYHSQRSFKAGRRKAGLRR